MFAFVICYHFAKDIAFLYHDITTICVYHNYHEILCNSCNMAMRDLPDMYARSLRAEGIHISQITNGHVTSITYHFVPIVTTPVV